MVPFEQPDGLEGLAIAQARASDQRPPQPLDARRSVEGDQVGKRAVVAEVWSVSRLSFAIFPVPSFIESRLRSWTRSTLESMCSIAVTSGHEQEQIVRDEFRLVSRSTGHQVG